MKKNKILKYLVMAFAFICSMFILDNAFDVSAGNITLNTGFVTNYTDDGTQILTDNSGKGLTLVIKKVDDKYIITKTSSSNVIVFTNCVYNENNIILCSNYYEISNDTGDITLGIANTTRNSPYNGEFKFSTSGMSALGGVTWFDCYTYTYSQYIQYGKDRYNAGKESADITSDNESAIQEYISQNNMKTEEEYLNYGNDQYNKGKQDGVNSVDLEGYGYEMFNYGYSNGYSDGVRDTDITSNDEEVINKYIEDNNMKTFKEYEEYGEQKYQLGLENADLTLDNELAIEKYIKNENMKTEQELFNYGNEQFELGKDYMSFGKRLGRFIDGIIETLFGWIYIDNKESEV